MSNWQKQYITHWTRLHSIWTAVNVCYFVQHLKHRNRPFRANYPGSSQGSLLHPTSPISAFYTLFLHVLFHLTIISYSPGNSLKKTDHSLGEVIIRDHHGIIILILDSPWRHLYLFPTKPLHSFKFSNWHILFDFSLLLYII